MGMLKRFEDGGRWCEVGKLRRAYFGGEPCYATDGRGDWSFYLGGADPLDVIERRDGWTIWYRPNNAEFLEHATEMERVGAWR